MLLQDNLRPTTMRRWTQEATDSREPLLNFFLERYQQAYKSELDAFVAALVQEKPLPVTPFDGLQALRLADACVESVSTGRAVKL